MLPTMAIVDFKGERGIVDRISTIRRYLPLYGAAKGAEKEEIKEFLFSLIHGDMECGKSTERSDV